MALLYRVKINIRTHLFYLPVQNARAVAFTINVLGQVWGRVPLYFKKRIWILKTRDIQSLLLFNILLQILKKNLMLCLVLLNSLYAVCIFNCYCVSNLENSSSPLLLFTFLMHYFQKKFFLMDFLLCFFIIMFHYSFCFKP